MATYPTPISASAADVARLLRERQSPPHVAADVGETISDLTAYPTALAYMTAQADALLAAFGPQDCRVITMGANSTTSTSFATLPLATFAITLKVAKPYAVLATVDPFIGTLGHYGWLRLKVTTASTQEFSGEVLASPSVVGTQHQVTLFHKASFAADAATTIAIQWRVNTGGYTLSTNTACRAQFLVIG